METIHEILNDLGLVAWLWAIPVCFLKGRRVVGWFGVLMLLSSTVLALYGGRYWRNGVIDDWWWALFVIQGWIVLALVATTALRPPIPGSWWTRHRSFRRSRCRWVCG